MLFRGPRVPCFIDYKTMIDKAKVTYLVEEFLQGTPYFLVDLKVSGRNYITVYIDGDQGVPISACVSVSRHIESQFDREVEDYDLDVSSVGIDRPLQLPRQFRRNMGREIIYTDAAGKKIKGRLLQADDESFTVEHEVKKKKKNEVAEDPVKKIPYVAVKDVKVQVSFKSIEQDPDPDMDDQEV
jgi:ribosome maturation factor RimP